MVSPSAILLHALITRRAGSLPALQERHMITFLSGLIVGVILTLIVIAVLNIRRNQQDQRDLRKVTDQADRSGN